MTALYAAFFAVVGLTAMMTKKNIFGAMLGVYFLFLGAVSAFLLASHTQREPVGGGMFSLFVLIVTLFFVVVGVALSIRMFFQKKSEM